MKRQTFNYPGDTAFQRLLVSTAEQKGTTVAV